MSFQFHFKEACKRNTLQDHPWCRYWAYVAYLKACDKSRADNPWPLWNFLIKNYETEEQEDTWFVAMTDPNWEYRSQVESGLNTGFYRSIPYHLYHLTYRWRWLRNLVLRMKKFICEDCGTQGKLQNLQVHHEDYDSLGEEDPISLTCLCKRCHAKRHGEGK